MVPRKLCCFFDSVKATEITDLVKAADPADLIGRDPAVFLDLDDVVVTSQRTALRAVVDRHQFEPCFVDLDKNIVKQARPAVCHEYGLREICA